MTEPLREVETDGTRVTAAAGRRLRTRVALIALCALLYAAMAFVAFRGGPVASQTYSATALLAASLIALTAIDFREQRLPDLLTLPLLAAGLMLSAASDESALAWHLLASVVGYGAFWLTAHAHHSARGMAGLGGGDAKLLAAGGAWTGPEALPTLVLVSAVTALLAVAMACAYRRAFERDRRIPFGPFLAVGIWYAWLFGPLLPS